MTEDNEIIDENSQEQKPTQWKFWYWGLMVFLAVQIGIYLLITYSYK